MIDLEQLQKLRAIAEGATPGPWESLEDSAWDFSHRDEVYRICEVRGPMQWDASFGILDAAHIAAFDPPTCLSLLAEIDRLHRVITRELSENDELGAEYTHVMALKEELEEARDEARRWEILAGSWMKSYDELKEKYEPLVAAIAEYQALPIGGQDE